jgi:hypothetical protein
MFCFPSAVSSISATALAMANFDAALPALSCKPSTLFVEEMPQIRQ